MVADAEKFKAEDELIRKKIEAKNGLENYIFQMGNTLNDEKLKTVFTADEKAIVEKLKEEGQKWIEQNPDADADAINAK